MNVKLSEEIKSKISSVNLAVLTAGVEVKPSTPELWELINKEVNKLEKSLKLDEVNKNVNIAGARSFYKLCGKDPNRYRPSADSLFRRIVKGNGLYKVNNVVDALNLISVKTGISIGGYDISKVVGNVQLDIGTARDEYTGIGRGKLNIEGLPVLRDEQGVFGSPTSDSERTMIQDNCKKVSFVFFNFGNDENMVHYLEEAACLLEKFSQAGNIEKKQVEL